MPIAIGSVEVDVVPSTRGIYGKLRDGLVPAATKAGEDAGRAAGRAFGPSMQSTVGQIGLSIGQQIGDQIASRIASAVRNALRDGITQGGATARPAATRQGDETAGAFARAMRARLQEAFRSLPKIQVGADTSEADSDLQALRVRMETLSSKRIGVDLSAEDARAEIDQIEAELVRLGSFHPDVTVRADTARARTQLAAVRTEIDRISASPGTVHLQTDGSFGARLRAVVQGAEAALPNITIGADTSAAQSQLAALRAQLTALRDQRVGIDIDAATAQARIDEIRGRLKALGASSADVSVRLDAGTAEAQLAAFLTEIKALDAVEARPKVSLDASGALSSIFQLTVALGVLAAIPAFPVLAAGAGSFTAAFTAAGVGVGVFAAAALPALATIKGALDAQKQAQDAASTATSKAGQTAAQAASRSLQLAGAQAALATAERNGARQIAQAREAVAAAVQQAALSQQQADRAVANAERDLTQAQKDQVQAQKDLTEARKTAAEQLQDLNNQQKDSVLALERAKAQVRDAQKQVDADNTASSKATADQRSDDLLALREAQQALVEQQIATQRLSDQTAAANKAGVKGSATYTQAQDQLAQAQQNVADKTQALKDAQADQARTQAANAKAIADAQQKVVDAQASAAESIASAQRQIASASLSAASSSDASATAADKYQQALNKLSPAARGTFNAFVSLRSAFKDWSKDLQPEIMPIFTRGINGAKNSLPGLTPLVLGTARGIGVLQDKVSKGFKSPWWQSLKRDFAGSVEPAIVRMGKIVGNIFIGLAGLIDAFLPHLKGVSDQSDGITRKFANWGKNLKGNPAFASFLAYSAQEAPKLGDALGKIATAFLNVGKALAPLSGVALSVIGALATGISSLATTSPGVLQLIYGIVVFTRLATIAQTAYNIALAAYRAGVILTTLVTQGWTAAQLEADAAFAANPIVAIILIIIVAIGLLVAGIIWAWDHWAWFRTSVLAVWKALQVAALFTWNSVLKPTFTAIATASMWLYTNGIKPAFDGAVIAYHALATAALWLWQAVLAPVFHAIGLIFSIWWAGVKLYFTAVITIFKMWAAIVWWLYQKTLAPVFQLIAVLFSWWWVGVKLYFTLVIAIFKLAGEGGSYLWTHYLKPAFSAIGDAGKYLWSHALQPAFNAMKIGIKAVGDSFVTAKDLISTQWSKVSDLAKKPVSFLINTVYNKGIIAIWNKVADIVDGPHLKPVTVKGFASGGVAEGVRPGYTPGRDTHLIAVGGGEAIMRPEFTRAAGHGWIDTMNAVARRGGVTAVQRAMGLPGYFGGGIIDTIGGAAKSVGGAIKSGVTTGIDWAKTGVDLIAHPSKVFDKLMSPVKGLISKAGGSQWAKLLERIPIQALKDLKNEVLELVGLGGGGSASFTPSAGIAQWIPTINQALALLGQPVSWLPTVEKRMNQESGGNPNIVNTWDSNWLAGHPSVGLMQVIAGTFRRWAGQFRNRGPFSYGVSVDPLANTYAGLNYAIHRYGSLAALGRPGGYDSGGYLQPGLNLAYNGTGRPEPVFTTQQANALMRLAGTPTAAGSPQEMTGTLTLSTGELLGFFRGVVHEENAELLTALTARPRG